MAIEYPLAMPTSPGPRQIDWEPVAAVAVARSPFTFQAQTQAHQGQMWAARVSYPRMQEIDARYWKAFLLKLNGRQGTFLFGDSVRKVPYGTALGTPQVRGASQTGQQLSTKGWTANQAGLLVGGMDWIQIGGAADLPFSATTTWPTDVWIVSRSASAIVLGFSDPCPTGGGAVNWGIGTVQGIQAVLAGSTTATVQHNVAGGTARLYAVLNDVSSDVDGNATIDIWPRLRESPDDSATLVLSGSKGTFRLKDNMMDFSVDFAKRFGFEIDLVEAI